MFEPKLSTEVDLLEIRLSCEKELAKHGGDYAVGAEMKRKEKKIMVFYKVVL